MSYGPLFRHYFLYGRLAQGIKRQTEHNGVWPEVDLSLDTFLTGCPMGMLLPIFKLPFKMTMTQDFVSWDPGVLKLLVTSQIP